ncbi:MAG: hypothetical protein IPM16_06700 [Chloroflexi bacterium]|nr:hypothetical protein [Chloroflexota bacterium]
MARRGISTAAKLLLLHRRGGGGAAFVPTDISGLALWLDASDSTTLFQDSAGTTPATANDDVIGRWADKSGNGNHATQETTANKPLLKTAVQNGLNTVRGDGTDDSLSFTGSGLALFQNVAYAYTFIVVDANSTSGQKVAFAFGYHITNGARYYIEDGLSANKWDWRGRRLDGDSATVAYSGTNHGGVPVLLTAAVAFASGSAVLRQNGTQVGTATPSTGSTSNTASFAARLFAADNGAFFSPADIAEVLVYTPSSAMSADDITAVEAYLNAKWAVY